MLRTSFEAEDRGPSTVGRYIRWKTAGSFLLPVAENVYWNEKELKAILSFTVAQNASADGTIDPSHIEFKFTGKDIYGNSMDDKFDQYIGFSGVAWK